MFSLLQIMVASDLPMIGSTFLFCGLIVYFVDYRPAKKQLNKQQRMKSSAKEVANQPASTNASENPEKPRMSMSQTVSSHDLRFTNALSLTYIIGGIALITAIQAISIFT
ncbi:hypothetical protein [Ferroacidibacillus organovorans]|uniref:Uncharacterized protein n=1 Tax=Ferroacidibacillus organovorans TaxID=1765683 RepID=A0A117SY77_9BACL|nr:hypothetical protein [Ferroacidibacillus organovorans]KUO96511.1 hypothetical protein ATW55_01250 [Ferroacidibacillus organovorans]